jgi:phosphate acetyltransferase
MTERPIVQHLRRHEKYERLIAATKGLQPLATAVAHPCDDTSLRGVRWKQPRRE